MMLFKHLLQASIEEHLPDPLVLDLPHGLHLRLEVLQDGHVRA